MLHFTLEDRKKEIMIKIEKEREREREREKAHKHGDRTLYLNMLHYFV